MKALFLFLSISFFCSILFGKGIEEAKKLTHSPGSLRVTVWNDSFLGPHHEPSLAGSIAWNGTSGVYGSSIVYGTQEANSINGMAGFGAHFFDMVNVTSNFTVGFTEENVGSVIFDQVSTALIRDDNAANPYGFDVIQKTYSKSGFNVVFCRNGYVNTTGEVITALYSSIGADMAIGNYETNMGGVDTSANLIYGYQPGTTLPYFGFVVLKELTGCKVGTRSYPTEPALREAIFTRATTIDLTTPPIGDQLATLGSLVGDIPVGDTAWVTFAIVAGDDFEGLRANAVKAFEIGRDAGWTNKVVLNYSSNQIINVPDDYTTIQEAINASVNGDTVLVADGTYFENINFRGKAITVASHFLRDSAESHRYNTIINGSKPTHRDSGAVVYMLAGEDTTSVLCGFTITGGKGGMDPYGFDVKGSGGIGIASGGKIENNIITGNTITHNNSAVGAGINIAEPKKKVLILNNTITHNQIITTGINAEGGAGIFCYRTSKDLILITGNVISDNMVLQTQGKLTGYGGGIYLKESKAQIKNNLIKNNGANFGGGIAIDEYPKSFSTDFLNNTIVNNEAIYRGGGIYANYVGTTPKMINSILWGNTAPVDPQLNNRVLVEYSDIEGGFTGTGNIDMDPLFVDESCCILKSDSPCLNTGCPETLYNDIDKTTNDMGCYGWLTPLLSTDVEEITNVEGIPNKYSLFQNYPNPFNPSTIIKYQLPANVKSETRNVKLTIYDILGNVVEVLVNEKQNHGTYQVDFNANNLSTGVYFYQLTADNFVETKKMILLR